MFVPPTEDELRQVEILKERINSNTEEEVTPELISELTELTYLRFLRGRKGILDDAYSCELLMTNMIRVSNIVCIILTTVCFLHSFDN